MNLPSIRLAVLFKPLESVLGLVAEHGGRLSFRDFLKGLACFSIANAFQCPYGV
jgi:hypothetical protein